MKIVCLKTSVINYIKIYYCILYNAYFSSKGISIKEKYFPRLIQQKSRFWLVLCVGFEWLISTHSWEPKWPIHDGRMECVWERERDKCEFKELKKNGERGNYLNQFSILKPFCRQQHFCHQRYTGRATFSSFSLPAKDLKECTW